MLKLAISLSIFTLCLAVFVGRILHESMED